MIFADEPPKRTPGRSGPDRGSGLPGSESTRTPRSGGRPSLGRGMIPRVLLAVLLAIVWVVPVMYWPDLFSSSAIQVLSSFFTTGYLPVPEIIVVCLLVCIVPTLVIRMQVRVGDEDASAHDPSVDGTGAPGRAGGPAASGGAAETSGPSTGDSGPAASGVHAASPAAPRIDVSSGAPNMMDTAQRHEAAAALDIPWKDHYENNDADWSAQFMQATVLAAKSATE